MALVDGKTGLAFWWISRDGQPGGGPLLLTGELQPGWAVLAPSAGGALLVLSDCCYDAPGLDPAHPNSEVLAGQLLCP